MSSERSCSGLAFAGFDGASSAANHIAATHWLREHGQEPSESKIATVSLLLSGRWEIMQRQGYQRNAIMHFVRILEGLGHVTRDEKTVCAGQVTRREVSFRMISPS
jgi:hypothetical protein